MWSSLRLTPIKFHHLPWSSVQALVLKCISCIHPDRVLNAPKSSALILLHNTPTLENKATRCFRLGIVYKVCPPTTLNTWAVCTVIKSLLYRIVHVKCPYHSSVMSTSGVLIVVPLLHFKHWNRFMQALENSRCPNNRAGGCYWQVMVFRLCGWWCSIHIWILSISVTSTSKWNIKEPSVWSNHVTSQLRTREYVIQTWNLHSFAWTSWTW